MQTTTKTILATVAASVLLAPAASADPAPGKRSAPARCQADITKAVTKDGKPKDKGGATSVVIFGMRILIADTDGDKKADVVLVDVNNDGTWDGGAFDCDHDGTLEHRWEDLNHNGEPDLGEITPDSGWPPKTARHANRDQQVRVGVGRCVVKVTLKPRGVRPRNVSRSCASTPSPVQQADIDGDGEQERIENDARRAPNQTAATPDDADGDPDVVRVGTAGGAKVTGKGNVDNDPGDEEIIVEDPNLQPNQTYGLDLDGDGDIDVVIVGTKS